MAKEVKEFAAVVINEAPELISLAKSKLKEAIEKKGPDEPVVLTETDYYLPVIYGSTGIKVSRLADLDPIIEHANELLYKPPGDKLWLPYLGHALDAGIAALIAQEIFESADHALGFNRKDKLWLGAPPDKIIKKHGSKILNKPTSGFAVLIGGAPSTDIAKQITSELKDSGFYVFLAGQDDGISMAGQLAEAGIPMGWDDYLVPFGPRTSSLAHVFGFLTRLAIMLGNAEPGNFQTIYEFLKERVFGFFMVLDQLDDEKYAMAAAGTMFGFLTMAQEYVPQLLPIHTLHRLR